VQTRLTELLRIEQPIVAAPMAGGPTTPELVAAVANAGALGTIAGAMSTADELRAAIRAVRALTQRPFAVNLFAPLPPPRPKPETVAAVQRVVAPHRERLGLPQPEPPPPRAWPFDDQLAVVVDEHVPVVSFAFGIPPVDALRDAIVVGTATTPGEAAKLEAAGVDAVVAQGVEAGGHRGGFGEDGVVPLAELVPQVAERVGIPIVAAGGIMDGRGIAEVLRLGASGAQLGTAFLYTRESGASQAWKDALRTHETLISAAYTGRPARGARTPFLAELQRVPPTPYPYQAQLLADVRSFDGYGWYLGGTGARRARELGAADLVETLAGELAASS
jgi:nitronate monooxygenase